MNKIFKSIANVLCGVLVVGAVAGAGASLYFGGKNNGWFDEYKKSDTEQVQPDNGDEQETADGLIVAPVPAVNKMNIVAKAVSASDNDYSINPLSLGDYSLTATIQPADATNKAVNWSIAWKNPSSTWASGKSVTTYATVTPSSDGSLTATVSCLKAFSEQIIVTCTSRDNTDITATCTVDYVKRVSSVALTLSGAGITTSGSNYKFSFGKSVTASYSVTYSDGTLTGDFAGGALSVTLDSTLFSTCKSAVTSSNIQFHQSKSTVINISLSNKTSGTCTNTGNFYEFFTAMGDPTTARSQWSQALYNYVNAHQSSVHASVSMPWTYKYNGNSYGQSSGSASKSLIFDLSSITVSVASVGLNASGLVV